MDTTAPSDAPGAAAVSAEGLGVRGPRGWAFRDVRLSAGPGSLIAIAGPSGSGRTSLLLALTGRMRVAAGQAVVAGHRLPRRMSAVRRVCALAHVPGVTELDPALTVAEHLRERALLERRFTGSPLALLRPRGERAAARARIDAALASAGLDLDTLPKGPRTAVRDLDRLESLRLSVALGLIRRPALLAVDDTDLKLSDSERERAWELLRGLTAEGVTVLAVCSEAPEGAVVVPTGPPDATEPAEATEPDGSTEPADPTGPAEPADPTGPAEPTEPTAPTEPANRTRPAEQTEQTGQTRPAGKTEQAVREPAAPRNEEGAGDAISEAGRA
ncbi:ATP-binding cassette domain-containing protein [Streptomyces sp. NPDC018031]|uniref:ATP-binding cassette domain-containing protein n=1 Tax=Streptomyces sp. NPDC018031 TaxID=3365033 RepID=UPI0037B5B6A3